MLLILLFLQLVACDHDALSLNGIELDIPYSEVQTISSVDLNGRGIMSLSYWTCEIDDLTYMNFTGVLIDMASNDVTDTWPENGEIRFCFELSTPEEFMEDRFIRVIFYGSIADGGFTDFMYTSPEGSMNGLDEWNLWCSTPRTNTDRFSRPQSAIVDSEDELNFKSDHFGFRIEQTYFDEPNNQAVINFNRPLPYLM